MPVDYDAAALAAARRYCGWVVTPVDEGVTVTVDGPNGRVLSLPSLHVTALTAVVEDGVELDVDDLLWSAHGLVRKASGALWSAGYGAIVVTMSHGFESAPDFDAAVASAADRLSVDSAGGQLVGVGPFRWSEPDGAFTVSERALLDQYRILPSP